MGNSELIAAREQMHNTELRAEAALVWCRRSVSLKLFFSVFYLTVKSQFKNW